jgi:DnaK suppressor protein
MGRTFMATALKNDEVASYREILLSLRARLRGDLDQLTDEALHRNGAESSGNLSNMPLHMADVGTENYDQEFDLELIENQQGTLDQIHEALDRVKAGTFGLCLECHQPIAKPRLQALPYTAYCIECARKMESR